MGTGKGGGRSVLFLSWRWCFKKCWNKPLGQCVCSAAEYLMALTTSQEQTLWNKGEMKNGDLQHLIIEQNGVSVASEEHAGVHKDFLSSRTQNPTADFWLLEDFSKRSSKVLGITNNIMTGSCHSFCVNWNWEKCIFFRTVSVLSKCFWKASV